ncbi:hypothetical protein ACJX0J_007024, partial [Zea mays]
MAVPPHHLESGTNFTIFCLKYSQIHVGIPYHFLISPKGLFQQDKSQIWQTRKPGQKQKEYINSIYNIVVFITKASV